MGQHKKKWLIALVAILAQLGAWGCKKSEPTGNLRQPQDTVVVVVTGRIFVQLDTVQVYHHYAGDSMKVAEAQKYAKKTFVGKLLQKTAEKAVDKILK